MRDALLAAGIVALIFIFGVLVQCLYSNDSDPPVADFGPPLPRFIILRDGRVPDLEGELNYYSSMGYSVSTAAGGIGGPMVILELSD